MADRNGCSFPISSPRRWRFHLWRGARSLESGDFRGARRHFAAAYRDAPDEPLVCLAWGRELQRAGDTTAAEKLLRRAWSADPQLDAAGLHLARLLGVHSGQRDQARAILDRIAARSGETAPILLLRAELELTPAEPTDYEAAKQFLVRAEALGANAREVRTSLARALNAEGVARSRQGDHHRALFALKRATDLDPLWAGPWVNRGAILERLGQVSRAQREYRRALRLDPANPVALFNLADSLRRHGRRRESERLYRRLLALEPAYPGGALGLRQLLEGQGPETTDPASPEP